jgi:hypothetical protein
MHLMCTALTLQVVSGAPIEPEQFFQTHQTISSYFLSSFIPSMMPEMCMLFDVCNVIKL